MPNPRVGDRQRVCSDPKCQKERKRRTQADWFGRNPDYYRKRRMKKRAEAERAAKESIKRGDPEVPEWPEPPQVPKFLQGLPWEYAQDQIGVQVTDFIAVLALLIARRVQDQIRLQSIGRPGDTRRHQARRDKDQSDPVPG